MILCPRKEFHCSLSVDNDQRGDRYCSSLSHFCYRSDDFSLSYGGGDSRSNEALLSAGTTDHTSNNSHCSSPVGGQDRFLTSINPGGDLVVNNELRHRSGGTEFKVTSDHNCTRRMREPCVRAIYYRFQFIQSWLNKINIGSGLGGVTGMIAISRPYAGKHRRDDL